MSDLPCVRLPTIGIVPMFRLMTAGIELQATVGFIGAISLLSESLDAHIVWLANRVIIKNVRRVIAHSAAGEFW